MGYTHIFRLDYKQQPWYVGVHDPGDGGQSETAMPPNKKMRYGDDTQAPTVMASRTRLYTVRNVDGDSVDLTNKEGIRFTEKKDDLVMVGEVESRVEVTPTQMVEKLDMLGGFFYIGFIKSDGTTRHMYAHVVDRPKGGHLNLQDLEKPMKEHRSCRMERVFSLITKGVHYVLKRPAFNALIKK